MWRESGGRTWRKVPPWALRQGNFHGLLVLIALEVLVLATLQCGARAAALTDEQLYEAWGELYGISGPADTGLPPEEVSPAKFTKLPDIPLAPHLEECTASTRMRRDLEETKDESGWPSWACASRTPEGVKFCDHPNTPWIRGGDDENLPLTRRVQRDIWVHQHPHNCKDPHLRFLLYDWADPNGIGSQIHLMGIALSVAVSTNRVLVPNPNTYWRSKHEGCKRSGFYNSFHCYFFELTSPECLAEATSTEVVRHDNRSRGFVFAASSERIVALTPTALFIPFESSATETWHFSGVGSSPFAILGYNIQNFHPKFHKTLWTRSQTSRYIMRWPTAYLCHVMNRFRHRTYGLEVAQKLVASSEKKDAIQSGHLSPLELESLQRRYGSLTALERAPRMRFLREPYLPRPILGMHVRSGDKGFEMKLFPFSSFMTMALRIRKLQPQLRNIWLSTLDEDVVAQANDFSNFWTMYKIQFHRQNGTGRLTTYEKQADLEEHVGATFADILIASQCDAFEGVWGSNLSRLINELRMTNGRRRKISMTLNYGEF